MPESPIAASELLVLHADDHVAVARAFLKAGRVVAVPGGTLTLRADVPAGHKVALRPVAAGAPLLKYGQVIGFARTAISAGDHVHLHNLEVRDFQREARAGSEDRPLRPLAAGEARTFLGYPRPGGWVGTRNYLAVLSTVNCSASVARYVRERFPDEAVRRDWPQVDGVIALTHKTGCGLQPGEPLRVLERVMAGMARHPNIGGFVLIGLGCEVNQMHALRTAVAGESVREGEVAPVVLDVQSSGGVRRTVEAGVAAVTRLMPVVDAARRRPAPLSSLMLALQCGGSDAHSGITANPALGVASDELVRHGGTSVLAETPEIYGAEHLLVRRAVSVAVAERLQARIRWWESHVRQHGATIDNNPAPGNKAGGLTTIYEKSLGAVAKGGQAPLRAVYEYAEPISGPGLVFMDTPGYDPVSMTGLVSGGCTLGVFTTGRGSVYGCKPAPCLKVATTTALYQWMEEDMDLNAGTILDGTETVEAVGRRIFEAMVAVAGGERTKSERLGIGDEEFAPWVLGPTF